MGGWEEGAKLGGQKGHQLGREVGFILGFAEEWYKSYSQQREEGTLDRKAERIVAALAKVVDLAQSFPSDNNKDEDVTERLDLLRAKFKLACSLLKINSDFGSGADSW